MQIKKAIGLTLSIAALSENLNLPIEAQQISKQPLDCCVIKNEENNSEISGLEKALNYMLEVSEIKSESGKITLQKRWTKEDKEKLAELFSNEEVHEWLLFPSVLYYSNKEEILKLWGNCVDKNDSLGKLNFVIKNSENDPVGVLEFHYLEKENIIGLGYWIGKPYWGNRYAVEAVTTLMTKIHEFKPDIRFDISISEDNENSKRAFKRMLESLDKKEIKYILEKSCLHITIQITPIENSEDAIVETLYNENSFVKITAPKSKVKWRLLKENKRTVNFIGYKIKLL